MREVTIENRNILFCGKGVKERDTRYGDACDVMAIVPTDQFRYSTHLLYARPTAIMKTNLVLIIVFG